MANINDYLDWRGDISFCDLPVGEVDALIFSLLSYINLEGIVPESGDGLSMSDVVAAYVEKYPSPKDRYLGLIMIQEACDLLIRLPKSRRFAEVKMRSYVNEVCEECEMQFSAVSFLLPNDTTVIAFRGTDDNIVGWKEDFQLSFRREVPSHKRAVEYILANADDRRRKLYTVGHSKGGHLSVWGAVHSHKRIRNKILAAYSFDGPGFLPEVIQSEQYREMSDRIHTLIPQSSLVGLLLDNDRSFQIVKSRRSGVFQHNSMYWEIMGGNFVRLDQLSARGVKNDTVLRERIARLSSEEREKFTEVIFDVISATGAKTLSELNDGKLKNAITVIKAANEIDKETKEAVGALLAEMLSLNLPKHSDTESSKKPRSGVDVTFLPLISDAIKKEKSPTPKKSKGN